MPMAKQRTVKELQAHIKSLGLPPLPRTVKELQARIKADKAAGGRHRVLGITKRELAALEKADKARIMAELKAESPMVRFPRRRRGMKARGM
jgi:indole-3-glycerol phosphate synthase